MNRRKSRAGIQQFLQPVRGYAGFAFFPADIDLHQHISRFSPALRQTMLAAGLTERHIRALLPLSEEQAGRLAEEIARRGLTVKETEALVEETLAPRPKREAPRFFIQDIRLLLNTIEKAVGRVKEAGLPIEASRSEEGEELVLTVRIPKKAAYRTSRHSA